MDKIKDKFKNLSKEKKRLLYGIIVVLWVISSYVAAIFGPNKVRTSFIKSVIYGTFTFNGFRATLIVFILLVITVVMILSKNGMINDVLNEDEKGVKFLKDGTYGSGNWMSKEEAKEVFTVGDISQVKEQVYGQFSTDGKEVVAFKANKHGGNHNTFMLGSPGTGKSYGFARTAVIQAILRGESVCITDPSSELYTDLAHFAQSRGAKVKVLNFVNPEYSNAWNCLYECVDQQTGRINSLRLQEFCSIFMRNTNLTGGDGGESTNFWYDAALNLMQAVIGYIAFLHERDLIVGYKKLIVSACKLISMSDQTIEEYIREVGSSNVNLNLLKQKYIEIAKEAGYTDEEIKSIIEDCEKHAHPFSIGEAYSTLLNFGDLSDLENKFEEIPYGHPAAIAFLTFNREGIAENVKASAQHGLLLRLKLFMDPGIRRITSNNDIVIEEMGRRQTVCFLITPDNSAAMKPLQALFFSFLFKDLSEAYDRRQAECERANIKNERLPVNIIMDEAYSNGHIANFGEALSTTRKRKIYVTMIWQTIGQIKEMYGENIADTLKSCCDILVFLGTGDLKTAEYVSSFSGMATVRTRTHKETSNGIFGRVGTVTEVNASEDAKPVMTIDDAMAINDEVVVIRRGYQHILKIKRFGYTEHPVYKMGLLKKSSIFQYKKSSEVYTAVDSVSNDISLKDLPKGKGNKTVGLNMTQFRLKKIDLPANKSFISNIEILKEIEPSEKQGESKLSNSPDATVAKSKANKIITDDNMFINEKIISMNGKEQ